MTVARWYRWAMSLPYVVPIIAGVIGRLTHFQLPPSMGFIVLLGIAAIYQTIPYTIFLIIVWVFIKPRSVRALRRTALLAPIVIAVPFAIVASLFEGGPHQPLRDILIGIAFYGLAALVFGYFYVALVEIGALIVRLCCRNEPPPDSIDRSALGTL